MKFNDSAKFEQVAFIKENDEIKRINIDELTEGAELATINDVITWAQTVKLYVKPTRTLSEKTLEKRAAQDAIRKEYEEKFRNICIENGLRIAENTNVANVIKVYNANDKYCLYIRSGAKTAQVLTHDEYIPENIEHTTIKYSLPASVTLAYDNTYEGTLGAIITKILEA